MQIVNVGSINVDHVYAIDQFVRPGETLTSSRYEIFAGGKGFNQSIALARAGAATRHTGKVGKDAEWLLDRLAKEGVDITHVEVTETATGHAIIQVVPTGENAIILYSGANHTVSPPSIARALSSCSRDDYLLLQNETSSVAEGIRMGKQRGLKIVFNPAPMTSAVRDYPLQSVDIFILNETEAEVMTGKTTAEDVRIEMSRQFPNAVTVLTMGNQGVLYFDADTLHRQPAFPVEAIDTTAAGDTFIGYFLTELMQSNDPTKALSRGCHAASICVTRAGASDSIPYRKELNTIQPKATADPEDSGIFKYELIIHKLCILTNLINLINK